MTENNDDPRIGIIFDMITRIASGDGEVEVQPTGKNDELDAIITGLKMLSEELTAKNVQIERGLRLLGGITENATSVIYVKDLDGRYLLMNRQYGEVFNFEPSEYLGKTD